jgi:hypothetical protein
VTETADTAQDSPPRKRLGRPTDRDVPRTSLDAWIVANESSSHKLATECAEIAERLGYAVELAPKRKGIDDMRSARFYPSLVAALLISEATGGAIGLEQWARDMVRFGSRRRSKG